MSSRGELLPGGLVAYEGTQLAHAAALTGEFWGRSEAELVRPGAPFFMHLRHTRPGPVTLGTATIQGWISAKVEEERDFYLVFLPQQGRLHLQIDGYDWVGSPGHGTICSPSDPFEVRLEGDTRFFCARIERSAMREGLGDLLGRRPVPEDPRFFPLMDLEDDRIASFERLALQICHEMAVHSTPRGGPVFLHQLRQSLITLLLECQPHSLSDTVRESRDAPIPSLDRALRFLRGHLDDAISVDDLAAAAGVSPRTLFRDFRNEIGASPMEVLRGERLERTRCELLSPDAETSVTRVAFRWGFNHLGRFAGFYRERFGETPSDTLQRAKRKAANEDRRLQDAPIRAPGLIS